MHEYMLNLERGYPLLFVEKNGDYRPAMAFWSKSPNSSHNPYARAEDPVNTLYLWSDLDGDEDISPDEIQVIPSSTGQLNHLAGFSYPLNPQFEIVLGGLYLKPARFTPEGIPVYDIASAPRLNDSQPGTGGAFFKVGGHLLGFYDLGIKPIAAPQSPYTVHSYLFTKPDGSPVGTYLLPGAAVHASMHLPPPGSGGETRGELFIAGIVDIGGETGTVVAVQGNYGESYLFTEDGLFITSLFKDSRLNPAGMGDQVIPGKDISGISLGQEAFGGWFGKQSDGKVRYMFGRLEAIVAEVQGLDAIKRFDAGLVESKGEMTRNENVIYDFFAPE